MVATSGSRRVLLGLLMPCAVVVALASCTAADEETDSTSAADTLALCGNGTRDPGEQCDDGNRNGLDGCTASCAFEQVQRMNSLKMLFRTDNYCTANALGGAVGSQAQSQLQNALADAVNNGQINVMFSLNGLADPTGAAAASVTVGSYVGDPVANSPIALDSWFTVQGAAVAPTGEPLATLPGTIANSQLSAGPGNVAFALALGGTNAKIAVSGARAKATLGAASAPTKSTNGSSPGHLASENLDPTLKAFATTTNGQLCGNVSAASLAAIPVPEQLYSGSTSCSQGYNQNNSLLDVFASGCTVFIVTAFKATQPDQVDASTALPGAGGPYKLVVGAGKKVTGCKDKNGGNVELDACLKSSAYSAAFQYTTQRAVIRGTAN